MIDDIPSGKRIWELAREAIQIERTWGFIDRADGIISNLDPAEKRFFETLLGPDYIAPEKRGKYWSDVRSAGNEVIEPETLRNLLLNGDSRDLEEAQKAIDDHIKKQCVAIENGRWPCSEEDGPLPSYCATPTYPSSSDDYDSHDWSALIMASNVLDTHKTVLDIIHETQQGEFQPEGKTYYHLVAKFSEQGTRWAVMSFYCDNFDERFNRTEIVETFTSLKHASVWVKNIEMSGELTEEARQCASGSDDLRCLGEDAKYMKHSTLPEDHQSTSDTVKLVRLLKRASAVSKIQSASECVIPTQVKQTTRDMEIGL